MFNTHRLIGSSLFVLFLFSTALAQENRAPIDTPREAVAPFPAGPLVTAAATAERVRFVSPGTVVQLRLEVYNETGQKLFDTELRGGNVLDWHLQDSGGERLAAGAYACVLTIKSLSGRLSQRVGLVTVNNKEAAIEAAGAAQLSPAQQQAIGPVVGRVEGNAAFTILHDESGAEAITAVTHDGTEGQLTSTRGALTFRTGDLFSGKDVERVRITEEGNVGIGTDKPEARLDVAGDIRARGTVRTDQVEFADGTVQTSGLSGRKLADGTMAPNATGTGTQNKVAKWTDNAGTLGDSSLTDTGGNVGLGVTNPGDLLDIAGAPNAAGRSGIHVRTTVSTGNATLYFDNDRSNFAAYGGVLTAGSTNPFTFFGVTRADKTFLIADGPSSLGLGIGTLVSKPVIFGTANAERMRIDSSGNVGIGTTGPGAKLDVVGDTRVSNNLTVDTNTLFVDAANDQVGIGTSTPGAKLDVVGNARFNGNLTVTGTLNATLPPSSTSYIQNNPASQQESSTFNISGTGAANIFNAATQFDIEGTRILGKPGNNNLFAGVDAGRSNASGGNNSYFGAGAGRGNVDGGGNSFFGASAGFATTGSSNAFFGIQAGEQTAGGSSNSFFGRRAGMGNLGGSNNTLIGANTGVSIGDLSFATAIGAGAQATASNTVVLGRTADSVQVPGNLNVNGALAGNGSGLINVPGTFKWQTVSGLAQQAQPNNGYLATNDAQVTITLPQNIGVGEIVRVSGPGIGGWKIAQNAGQSIIGTNIGLLSAFWTPHESNRKWSSVASSADGTKLVATVENGQIHTSTNSGESWEARDNVRAWWAVASSADGSKLVAIVNGGQIYTSTNSGVSWDPQENNRNWEQVASSADGTKLVAAVNNGNIYTSTDSGVSWIPRRFGFWSSLASSADGTKLVATESLGAIHTSTDSGANWTQRGGSPNWVSVASSADGTKLVAVVYGGQVYVSNDSGLNWSLRENNRDWWQVASSSDGSRLVAVVPGPLAGIFISTDSGTTWTPSETSRNWRSVASSADGSKLVAVAQDNLIYTSTIATTTTVGTAGYLTGGQSSAIELQYIGNGKFMPISHSGPISGF